MARDEAQREEEAERELGHTEVGRGTALALVLAFLATIAFVPAVQLASGRAPDLRPLVARLPTECTLERFERGLEDDSAAGGWLLPRLQGLLARFLRLGNEQVYLGRDGWLYHRGGVDYAMGPGFLEDDVLARRRLGGDACDGPPQPDPVAAVAGFAEALAARGVRLVAVPTPVKAVVEPARLARRGGAAPPVQNPSYDAFVRALEARGVEVFDPTPLLLEPGSYLATDTHWRPEAVERVAAALAARLEASGALAGPRGDGFSRAPERARHYGDLVLLLNLARDQALYAPEEVTPRAVLRDGAPWRPTRGAEVLLLGDSFSNVYSDAAAFRSERLGGDFSWGEGAGLAEQLSFALARPLDRIVRNAGGAWAARSDLAREVAREAEAGRDRLAGVRVVVWQFAVRELAQGDWREIALAPRPAGAAAAPEAGPAEGASAEAVEVVATLAARAEAPVPGSVPYRDALVALHLRDVAAAGSAAAPPPPHELVAYVIGMRDDDWTPLARLAPGARVRLRLEPWDAEAVQRRVGSLNRVELDDLDMLALPAFFGEPPAGPAELR
jgi:alginate O-acetyltransferase complex protein AlgJ